MRILKELELQKEVQDNIVNEYNKLKQHEACIIGDVVAVLLNGDTTLGKPKEIVNHDKDTIYIVFEPTKLAKVCGIHLDVISNKENTYKFIPVETLVFKLFEFNFMFTHMVTNEDAWIGITDKYKKIFKNFELACLEDENFELRFKKEATTAYCIWQDIICSKFKKKEVILEKLYLVTYLLGRLFYCDSMALLDDYMKCYKNCEITEILVEKINKINAINLKIIESFKLNKDDSQYKINNYKKSYKLLNEEESTEIC